MATLASVVVKLGANTSGFITDMTRAAKHSETTSQKMAKGFKVAAAAVTAAVGGVAAATGKMVADTAQQADKFQKLTDRIGGSVEAFSELEFVAERSGVKFETLTMGLQRMTRRIGEVANTGKGEAAPALEQLGLEAEKLASLPLDKQFEAIAEELSKVENTSIRTSLAMKVFDSEGVSLVQTMGEGAAGIQALRERARELGVTLTSETAASAVELRDRMTDMRAQMEGAQRQFVSGLIPALVDISRAFDAGGDSAEGFRKVGEKMGQWLIKIVEYAIRARTVFQVLGQTIGAMVAKAVLEIDKATAATKAFLMQMGIAASQARSGNLTAAWRALKGSTKAAGEEIDKYNRMIDNLLNDYDGEIDRVMSEQYRDLANVTLTTIEVTGEYRETLDRASDSMEQFSDAAANAGGALQAANDPALDLVEVTGEMRAGFDAVHPSMLMAADAAEESAQRMTSAMAGNTGVAAVIENTFKRLDDTLQGVWRDLIDGTSSATEAVKNLFKDMLAQLLHASLTQPIVLSIGAAFTGATGAGMPGMSGGIPGLGSIFGGGSGGGGFLSGIGSLFTGNQIGMGFQNLPTWLGGTSTGLSNSAGFSLFGNASQYANWQYGLTGILGGLLGDRIFGGMGGIGGGVGSAAGLAAGGSLFPALGAFGGPLGAILGGLLGGALGGLFGDRPFSGALGGEGRRTVSDNTQIETAFGAILGLRGSGGVGRFEEGGSFLGDLAGPLQEFDNALAQFLTPAQLDRATDAFRTWEFAFNNSNTAAQDILGSRFDVVLGVMPDIVRDFVQSFDGLEARVDAFEEVVVAFNTMSAAVAAFINSDPAAEVERLINGTEESSTERLRSIGSALSDALANFDGTPAQMTEIAALMDARYRSELEYLQAIQGLIQSITQSVQSQREQITEALRGPDTRTFGEIIADVQQFISAIGAADSPEGVAALVEQAQSSIGAAFNIANSDEGNASQFRELLALLDVLEAAALGRLDTLSEDAIGEGEALRAEATAFADAFSIPLQDTTAAVNDATSAVNNQTDIIVREHEEDRRILVRMAGALSDLSSEVAALRESDGRIGFVGG